MIKPSISTHGKRWGYATKDLVMAALFLSDKGGDLTCSVGRDRETGIPYVCERFTGALDYRYANVKGSKYMLSSETFMENKKQCKEEVVSESEVTFLEEITINDVRRYLIELSANGKVKIFFYPDRPIEIPDNDEDLVYRGIIRMRKWEKKILESFRRYHPHLVSRILRG